MLYIYKEIRTILLQSLFSIISKIEILLYLKDYNLYHQKSLLQIFNNIFRSVGLVCLKKASLSLKEAPELF